MEPILFLLSGIIVFNWIKVILFNPLMNSVDNFLIVTFNTLKWITLFLSFFGFQQYLKTRLQRVKFIKFFNWISTNNSKLFFAILV